MAYRTDLGKLIPDKKDLIKINPNGRDGEVYRNDKFVIKFVKFSDEAILYMDMEKLRYFRDRIRHEYVGVVDKNMHLNRIDHQILLTPVDVIFLKEHGPFGNLYEAYLTKYVEHMGLGSLTCNEFLVGIEEILEAYKYLASKNLMASERHGGHVIANNGKLYITGFDRTKLIVGAGSHIAPFNESFAKYLAYEIIRWGMLEMMRNEAAKKKDTTWLAKTTPLTDWMNKAKENPSFRYHLQSEVKNYKMMSEYLTDKMDLILKKK